MSELDKVAFAMSHYGTSLGPDAYNRMAQAAIDALAKLDELWPGATWPQARPAIVAAVMAALGELWSDNSIEIRLAASLYAVLYNAHTVHSNTTGPHGGVGGQAITSHCHIIHPHPASMYWTQLDLPSEFLREWIKKHPDVDIAAEAKLLQERWLKRLRPTSKPSPPTGPTE